MAPKKPAFIYASRDRGQAAAVIREAASIEMDCVVVSSVADLREALTRPEVYLVFLAYDFADDLLPLHRSLAKGSPVFWIYLAPKSGLSQIMKLYNEGFHDVLTLPVHPTVVKNRATMYVGRFLQRVSQSDVKVPSWFDVRRLGPPNVLNSSVSEKRNPGFFANAKIPPEKKRHFIEAAALWSERSGATFTVINDIRERESLVRETAHISAPLVLWTEGRSSITRTSVATYDQERQRLAIRYPENSATPEGFRTWIEGREGSDLFANFNLHRGRCFFLSEPSHFAYEPLNFTSPLPPTLFNVQRREEIRLIIPNEDRKFCVASFGGRREMLQVSNLSAGGLCFEAHPALIDHVRNDSSEFQLDFSFHDLTITTRVSHRWTQNGLMGVRFEDLDPATREHIRLLVFESMYDYLKTYVLKLA